jgi:hypothetical protein
MSTWLTAQMSDAIKARLPMVLLAEIEHPDGTARFWSGVGPLSWDGYTWTGSGKLGSIAPIRHTSNLEIQEINFGMAGVDPLDIAQLSDNVRNLGGRVWLACLGPGNSVIRDPFQIVDAARLPVLHRRRGRQQRHLDHGADRVLYAGPRPRRSVDLGRAETDLSD